MLRKRQRVVQRVDLLLFQPVDLADVGLHDPLQAGIVETMNAVIGYCRKTAPDFVCAARPRIEAANTVCDGPLNRRIVAGVKVKRTYPSGTSPVSTV